MRGGSPGPGAAGETAAGTARGAGLAGHRQREGERGAAAGAGALGPDAAAVRLDESLRDGEPEAVPRRRALPCAGVLAEQVRQRLGRHPASLVGDRDGDVRVLAHGRHPDRGRLGSMPRGVGQEVVEHLHDAPAVGHHGGQPRRQVDEDGVPAAAAEERAARPLDQGGRLRGLGGDRERARVDAPRIEQVADEAAHVGALLGDDAVQFAHLGRVELGRLLQQRVGRALDGDQRGAQLVAHQAEELGPHPFDLVERGQVLHGHHHRPDPAPLGTDRRGVDQRPDAAPVGDREHDLLGAHRLAGAERLHQGHLGQRHLPPVGAADRDHLEELLGGAAGRPQALDDAPRLAVERDGPAGAGVEDHDPDRRGLDQGLEVGPRAPLAAVRARVGDRGRGLGREQRQHLLVVVGERLAVGLLGEEEVADVLAPVAHRRALEGPRERPGGRDAERADVAREVGEPQRPRQLAQVLEQAAAVGPGEQLLLFLGREAREEEVLGRPPLVDGGDDAVAGAGELAGALDDLAEHGVDVEGGVDAQDGCVEAGDALAQRPDLPPRVVGLGQGFSFAGSARIGVGRRPGAAPARTVL